MPKKKVVEFECDRCGKTWLVPADKQDDDTPQATVSFINAEGKEEVAAHYEVLCDSCSSAVRNYLGSVVREKKPEDEKSRAKEVEAEATTSDSVTLSGDEITELG